MLLTESSCHIAIVTDQKTASLCLLRCNDNHTIGTLRTIDGSRRGILQHVDTLNVVGVDIAQRTTLHTIDDDQRLVATTDGTVTTNTHFIATHVQTRDTALQSSCHIARRGLQNSFALNLCYGTRQVALLHGTETDDHDLVEALHVRLHLHPHIWACCQRQGLVTCIGELELLAFSIVHREVSFDVSDASDIGSDDLNGDTNHRLAILVHYITFDRLRLLNFDRHSGGNSRVGQYCDGHKQRCHQTISQIGL